jgi:hypothetical protein
MDWIPLQASFAAATVRFELFRGVRRYVHATILIIRYCTYWIRTMLFYSAFSTIDDHDDRLGGSVWVSHHCAACC